MGAHPDAGGGVTASPDVRVTFGGGEMRQIEDDSDDSDRSSDDAPQQPEPDEPQGPTPEQLRALEELDAEIVALSADGYFREALDEMVGALEACFAIHGPGSEPLNKRRASTVRFALGLAHQYVKAGEVEDAHALMFEAESLAANSADLIIEVITQNGDCYRQAGEYREALLELERAVKMQRPEAAASNGITPDAKRDAETHLILGAVLSQTGNHHDSVREAQRAILLAQQALHAAVVGEDDQSELSAIKKAAEAPKDDVLYYVSVRTGDEKGAGTDANVSITLLGDYGEAGPLALGSDPLCDFEQDQDDQFEVSAPDLGEVTQIKVEHDGKGLGADWYLETVTISKAGGRPRTFKADQWLKGVHHARSSSMGHMKVEHPPPARPLVSQKSQGPTAGLVRQKTTRQGQRKSRSMTDVYGRDNGTGVGAEVTLGVPPEQRRERLEARARHQRMNRAEKLLATLAAAYHNAGVELEWLGRMTQAYGSYEKALSLTTQLGPAHPTTKELTKAYAYLPFVHDEGSEADSDAEPLEMMKESIFSSAQDPFRPGSAYQSKSPMNFDKLMSMVSTARSLFFSFLSFLFFSLVTFWAHCRSNLAARIAPAHIRRVS